MRKVLSGYLAMAGLILAACSPLWAHHGSAAYENKAMELKAATVTKYVWSNPHVLVYFDAKDDKGEMAHWIVELGSPTNVSVLGWTRNSLHTGDMIDVFLWPAKSGKPVGRMNRVVLAGGKVLRDSQLGGGEGEGGDK